MNYKAFAMMGLSGILGLCAGFYAYKNVTMDTLSAIEAQTGVEFTMPAIPDRKNLYGDYLGSVFAQQRHDWKRAGDYLGDVMLQTPDDVTIQKRAMILAMGAGETDRSITLARKVYETEKNNSLALLFLAAGSLHDKNYQQASAYIKEMAPGSLSDFIMPLLESWTQAGVGVYTGEKLTGNTIHLHHAILIADYLGKKDEIEKLLAILVQTQKPAGSELERIGDIYAHIGKTDKALGFYEKAAAEQPGSTALTEKLQALRSGQEIITLQPVSSAENGVAIALYNMAQLLYQDMADESARVFANIALYLDPGMTDASLLLASITSRNERTAEAINYYRSIKPESDYYIESRRRAAELLEDSSRTEEALAELNSLVTDHNDMVSLIRIGDIYRREENFKKAVHTYDEAVERLGGQVPKEYWQLLYGRGMSLERLGEWSRAENDLKAALAYQPDHPYVLNYLGYAWTDQGVNLDQALAMIKKAVELQPSDGYITDSLGWVYYRRHEYKEAVRPLETAVELLPYDPVINDHLGDAYWRVGRKLEARFQWQRAKNYSTDAALIATIDQKLAEGLKVGDPTKETHSSHPEIRTGDITQQ